MQESLTLHGIRLGAVRTDDNTADVGTKTLLQARLTFLASKRGLEDFGQDQQVMMLEARDDPEETPTPWLLYVFVASLTMNAMTVVWHCKCKKRLPQQPPPPTMTTTSTQTVNTQPTNERTTKAFVTTYGDRWHLNEHCQGLAAATTKRTLEPCGHCCRGRLI